MQHLEEDFPGITDYTYLNTAAVGLIPRRVFDYKQKLNSELLYQGSGVFANHSDWNARLREKIAEVFSGDPQYVALFPAFSYGFNAILEGLPKKSKILLLKEDYPSINRAVEARDFKLISLPIDFDLEEQIYEAFKTQHPDVFIFSQVQYLNGIKIDPSFLKKLKEEFPDTLLIADGTQYLGTEVFNFEDSPLDVLGASAYKWIGAGFGNGFFMFKPQVEERIEPKNLGFGSTMGKYKEQGDTFIGKFEGNHMDPATIGSITAALEYQESIGFKRIEATIKKLSSTAKSIFSELGILENAVVKRKQHSSIFSLKGSKILFEKLIQNSIICAQRGEGIRVGFHYYNTMEDLNKLVDLLKE